jgi:hypothetical protein
MEIGNGKKIKFWEGNCLGPSSLALQFWEIYAFIHEQSGTIAELWDGTNLKYTFRKRCRSKINEYVVRDNSVSFYHYFY